MVRSVSTSCSTLRARLAAVAATAALSSGQAVGAELVIADVRLGVHTLPTDFDYTVKDGNHSATGSTSFQSGYGLDARLLYAFGRPGAAGAFFTGLDLFGGWYNYDSSGTYRSLSARLLGGYAYALTERVSFEFTPFVGYGLATFNVPGQGIYDDISVSGTQVEYGAMVGAAYAITPHWLVDGEVGWMATTASLSGSGLTLDMKQSGPAFFLGLVYRFSAAPPRVE